MCAHGWRRRNAATKPLFREVNKSVMKVSRVCRSLDRPLHLQFLLLLPTPIRHLASGVNRPSRGLSGTPFSRFTYVDLRFFISDFITGHCSIVDLVERGVVHLWWWDYKSQGSWSCVASIRWAHRLASYSPDLSSCLGALVPGRRGLLFT